MGVAIVLSFFRSEALRFQASYVRLHPSMLVVQVLIIGGGIANFTDVAATFTGIITALKQYAEELRDGNISIWVRRAGPNYQEVCGARHMTELSCCLYCTSKDRWLREMVGYCVAASHSS